MAYHTTLLARWIVCSIDGLLASMKSLRKKEIYLLLGNTWSWLSVKLRKDIYYRYGVVSMALSSRHRSGQRRSVQPL